MKLTKSIIENLKPTKKSQEIYWDNVITDLGVRVNAGGSKSWVIRYRIKGRRKLKVLGPTRLLTLEDARKRAKLQLLKALDDVDPNPTRGIEWGRFCEIYMERHAKRKKTSWKEDQRRIDLYILPAFKNRSIKSIERSEIANLHFDITVNKKFPYSANRVVEQLQMMFKCSMLWGFREESGGNPAWGIDPNPETQRDRWITEEEMPFLSEAIKAYPNIHIRVAIWTYLLTGLRKMELLAIKWSDIDWSRKTLRIFAHKTKHKTGKPKYIPLCETVIELLNSLPRQSIYVFPGTNKRTHRKNIDKAWKWIRRRAGLEHEDPALNVQLHDLRRTVGAWLADDNFSMKIIGEVLHQSSERATQVYAHIADRTRRAAIEHNEARMRPFIQELGESSMERNIDSIAPLIQD